MARPPGSADSKCPMVDPSGSTDTSDPGHFGPKTVRHFLPKCPLDTSAPSKNVETVRH